MSVKLKTYFGSGSVLLIVLSAFFAGASLCSGTPLLEEGFNYPAGTGLASNPPWTGSASTALGVVSGNLSLTNLEPTVPAGNEVQINGSSSRTTYRTFGSYAITNGAVYCSMLLYCAVAPTNSQLIACLMQTGSTSPNAPDDPLDFYITTATNSVTNGFTFRIGHAGDDPATVRRLYTTNTLHFVVLKYTFSTLGAASIYVDPVPGAPEPASPDARTSGDDGGNTNTVYLQNILLHSFGFGPGNILLDSLRIATNWADADLGIVPLTLAGPTDEAICYGSPATFTAAPTGTPPYTFLWRTNGMPIQGATNNFLSLSSPNGRDAMNGFDVVVTDTFGSCTSQVAHLFFTTNAPFIVSQPTSQLVTPGISNATFTVTPGGDVPLVVQWRKNGAAIAGATNNSYLYDNVTSADVTNFFDVVASNPCGSVTSSPPVTVLFPNVFNPSYDAGAGFFSGENIILTNVSGMTMCVWSSPDLTIPVTGWKLEGVMSELPLGTSGNSRYGINVNPGASPTYYIFAVTNAGPYAQSEAVAVLTTPDYVTFTVVISNMTITADGYLNQEIFYPGYDAGAGFFSGENLMLTNSSGMTIYVWSSPDLSASVTNWFLEGTMAEMPLGTSGSSRYGINVNPVTSPVYYIFSLNNVGPYAPIEALAWLTTPDFSSFILYETNLPIGQDGIFIQAAPAPPNAFMAASDAGAGFFSGENLVFTSGSGTNYYAWSSYDPTLPVTSWKLEGPISEFPQGTTGNSVYGINLNPITSPEYFIFAQTNTGPYLPAEPLTWLATADFGSFSVTESNCAISGSGIFSMPPLPVITTFPTNTAALAGQNAGFNVAATGNGLGYIWSFEGTPVAGATNPIFSLPNVSVGETGSYIVTVTNADGGSIRCMAGLTVVPPPTLSLNPAGPGTVSLNASSIAGLTYVVQVATNLVHPVWTPIATNQADTSGTINFQPAAAGNRTQFFRLTFP